MLSVYQTAVEYHMYHTLGIILIGVVINVRPGPSLMRWAAAIKLVRSPIVSIFQVSVTYAG
ncbi:MAG: DUF423 domain-containing protein [Gammaproteobacteria bacterium]|jgi:uncharacterized membrane protein YgdD (TMEM256/DUF423 family)|nr:DUF423 domain-containing protein [Gammaproteobacteria bacterium]